MDPIDEKLSREIFSQFDSLVVTLSSIGDYDLIDEILKIKWAFEKRHFGDKNDNSEGCV